MFFYTITWKGKSIHIVCVGYNLNIKTQGDTERRAVELRKCTERHYGWSDVRLVSKHKSPFSPEDQGQCVRTSWHPPTCTSSNHRLTGRNRHLICSIKYTTDCLTDVSLSALQSPALYTDNKYISLSNQSADKVNYLSGDNTKKGTTFLSACICVNECRIFRAIAVINCYKCIVCSY